jgi:hypothetical protein
MSRAEAIGFAIGAFRVDVDEAHLHRRERVVEITLALITVAAKPGMFRAPEDVFLRYPDVSTAAAEAEGLETHRVERDVAGKDHEIGPGDILAELLLDGPKQAPSLVEADIVRPAIEWSKTLRAHASTAAAIVDAVRAGAVPCHADEEWTIVAEVRGPPALRVCHQRVQVLDHCVEIEGLELCRVVEVWAHRTGQRGVLVQDSEVEAIGPPMLVARDLARVVRDRAMQG